MATPAERKEKKQNSGDVCCSETEPGAQGKDSAGGDDLGTLTADRAVKTLECTKTLQQAFS